MKGEQILGTVICCQILLAKHIITSMKDSLFKEVSSHIELLQRRKHYHKNTRNSKHGLKSLSFTSSILISVSVLLKTPLTTSPLLSASYMWGTILLFSSFGSFLKPVSTGSKQLRWSGMGVLEMIRTAQKLSQITVAQERSSSAGKRQGFQHRGLQLQALSQDFTCTSFICWVCELML